MSWRPLAPALLLAVSACDSATTSCPQGQTLTDKGCTVPVPPSAVRGSSVGFVTNAKKRATYVGPPNAFQVRREDDDEIVFEGTTGPDVAATDTAEVVSFLDFDELTDPGTYVITVDGSKQKSAAFSIGDDVFVEPFHAAMLGMYGLRCGSAVSFEWQGIPFGHDDCHTGDEAPGGWHDAGDYGKYTTNGSFSLAMMLVAWDHFKDKLEPLELEIPERGGALPDFLDECRYQVEWLLAMQAEDGSVHDRLTSYCQGCTARNQPFDPLSVMPESTITERRLAPYSTPATADFAAVVARAARVFEPYDPDFAARARDAALAAWAFLLANPAYAAPTNVEYTGYYVTQDPDDKFWAAAEIWETTGDAAALAAAELASMTLGARADWDWSDVQNLGVYTYLLSKREGRDPMRIEVMERQVVAQADAMATMAEGHGYGRSLGSTYYWGINGIIARSVMNFVVAERLASATEDQKLRYRGASGYQLDHLFGRNFYGRSFVTGVGHEPPKSPHHRPSIADGIGPPWPGLLIGGPSGQSQDGMPVVALAATSWKDESGNYTTNEVAINWSGALVYALAAFLP